MPLMPPGSETGVYYIPVSNLPWNTTWKKLKDHARNQQPDGSSLAILEANVLGPSATNGWVSVRGLADFRAAVNHLNHSPMEDNRRAARTLQADDRNETQPIMLGEDCTTGSSRSLPCSQQHNGWQPVAAYQSRPSPQEFYSNITFQPAACSVPVPISPTVSESSYYQPPSPHYHHTQTFTGFAPQNEYVQSIRPVVLVPVPQIQQPLYVVPLESTVQTTPRASTPHHAQLFSLPLPPSPVPTPEVHHPPQLIKTEARKIIITRLPLSCSEKEIQELITKFSSTPSRSSHSSRRKSPEGTRYHLQHLEIAKHANGSPKGHAFAVLESYATAKSTIDALNGLSWQGRTLHARFAKEGVESKSRSARHTGLDPSASCHRVDPRSMRVHVAERQVPRSMAPEPQYRYIPEAKVMEAEEYLGTQYSNIQLDYRGESSSYSSPSASFTSDAGVPDISNLSVEGEDERCRKLTSDDAGSHTPVVVDGSSCGKSHK